MDLPTWKRKLVDGANAEFQRAVLVAVLGEDHETHVAWLEEVSGEASVVLMVCS